MASNPYGGGGGWSAAGAGLSALAEMLLSLQSQKRTDKLRQEDIDREQRRFDVTRGDQQARDAYGKERDTAADVAQRQRDAIESARRLGGGADVTTFLPDLKNSPFAGEILRKPEFGPSTPATTPLPGLESLGPMGFVPGAMSERGIMRTTPQEEVAAGERAYLLGERKRVGDKRTREEAAQKALPAWVQPWLAAGVEPQLQPQHPSGPTFQSFEDPNDPNAFTIRSQAVGARGRTAQPSMPRAQGMNALKSQYQMELQKLYQANNVPTNSWDMAEFGTQHPGMIARLQRQAQDAAVANIDLLGGGIQGVPNLRGAMDQLTWPERQAELNALPGWAEVQAKLDALYATSDGPAIFGKPTPQQVDTIRKLVGAFGAEAGEYIAHLQRSR